MLLATAQHKKELDPREVQRKELNHLTFLDQAETLDDPAHPPGLTEPRSPAILALA